MNNEEKRLNIYERIHRIMSDVKGVAKDSVNKHGGYKYAGHEAVTEELRPAYIRHGVHRSASVKAYHRNGGDLALEVEVRWTCVDNPSDFLSVVAFGESGALTKSGGVTPQQAGIALSYAVKNAEFKVFALTGDDTPDGDAASPHGESILEELIERYESAETAEEISAVSADVRKNWKNVSRFSAQLQAAKKAAEERIK